MVESREGTGAADSGEQLAEDLQAQLQISNDGAGEEAKTGTEATQEPAELTEQQLSDIA